MVSKNGGRTDVVFTPLASLNDVMEFRWSFEAALEAAKGAGDKSVKVLNNQGHVKMREDAMIYSYSHKVVLGGDRSHQPHPMGGSDKGRPMHGKAPDDEESAGGGGDGGGVRCMVVCAMP